jgi:transmembrane 9 superfamily protein 2/4
VRTGRFTSGASLSLNLGEVLRGDRITVSDYELVMGDDQEARYLCSQTVDKAGLKQTKDLIKTGYVAEWIVDNLPGATSFQTTDKSRKYYAAGFKIGDEVPSPNGGEPTYFLNNHVTLVIRWHRAGRKEGEHAKKVIVGFEVFPKSISAGNRTDGVPADINNVQFGLDLVPRSNSTGEVDEAEDATLSIPFTYSVYFREEETLEWKNRWSMYFVAQDDSSNIHWLAIINSLVIAGLLTAVVAVILARTVQGDITAGIEPKSKGLKLPRTGPEKKSGLLDPVGDLEGGADLDSDDEAIEDTTSWKLLHGDVFRPPPHGGLLAPLVGSGTQLIFMATGLLILGSFGVLNPSFRGGYISVGTGLFVFAGLFSGYFSSRVYKTFGGQLWKKNVVVTAALVPGLLFATIFFLNLFVWIQASSNAIPFGTLIALVALWLFIQLPLVYVGGWYGYEKVGAWSHPIKANAIPRQIPTQAWFKRSAQIILLAGLVPFLVVFIELMFVFKSLWQDKSGYYYVFGFLAVVCGIQFITIIEVTIVATYVQLCAENYHWWWASFLAGASSSLWIYIYLVYYYFAKLHITGFVSSLLFFFYGFLACGVYGLLAGTVGFLAAYAFVRRIYRYVK